MAAEAATPACHCRCVWIIAAVAALFTTTAFADPPTPPVAPLLQQLSDETQRMYAHARLGMVRVRLPTPQWLIRQNRLLLAKWGAELSPAAREQFLEAQERSARPRPTTGPTTGPTGEPSLGWPVGPTGLTVAITPIPDRVLVATGLLIDPAGDAVFPLYVDRSDLNGKPLAALSGDGHPTVATFVGSDRITNLTVLKLANPGGHPADLGTAVARPTDGSLAMVVAADGSARLAVWTATTTDTGLVLRPDGTCSGFAFADDFLPVATARPIVDQLIATGTVQRPRLGVTGLPVHRAELFDPALPGGPAAIRITSVDPGSAAARADLRPGDVILAVAGQSVGPRTFAAVITGRRGATEIRVRRGAETITLTVDLRLD